MKLFSLSILGADKREGRLCAITQVSADVIPSQISLASNKKWATMDRGLVDITGDSCAFASRAAAAATVAAAPPAPVTGRPNWRCRSTHLFKDSLVLILVPGKGRNSLSHWTFSPLLFLFFKEEAECAWLGADSDSEYFINPWMASHFTAAWGADALQMKSCSTSGSRRERHS